MYYCSSVWSNTTKENIKKLQLVQNFAARIITGLRKFDHITPALKELGWLNVNHELYLKDTTLVYKCLHNLVPISLSNKFKIRSEIHCRNTRGATDLQLPLFKLATGQRSFSFKGAKIWNSLDAHIKNKSSLKLFNSTLRKELLEKNIH